MAKAKEPETPQPPQTPTPKGGDDEDVERRIREAEERGRREAARDDETSRGVRRARACLSCGTILEGDKCPECGAVRKGSRMVPDDERERVPAAKPERERGFFDTLFTDGGDESGDE